MKADRALLALAVLGAALNAILFFRISGVTLAGCGGGSGCDSVLASEWSAVFLVPLPVAGLAVYLALLVAVVRKPGRLVGMLAGVIAGAAVWLIAVQAFVLGAFCPWCMAAHAVGLLVAGRVMRKSRASKLTGGWALVSSVVLAGGQWLGPERAGHRLETVVPHVSEGPVHARGPGREVTFADGRRVYNVDALPRLGPADAKHVLVEYFDYQCPACLTMHGHLEALRRKYPREICVIVLPVPLEASCNPAMAAGDDGYAGSCELARQALAVWQHDPAAFPAFHEAALAGNSASELSNAGGWGEELIRANIADWVAFSRESKHLPKLLIGNRRILHGLPSGTADFIRVMERELGL